MSDYTYGTTAGSAYSISFSPTSGTERPKTPAGLIVTRAVETKDGWLGQILVDKEIMFQSAPHADGEDAIKEANSRVVAAVKGLFVDRDSDKAVEAMPDS